MGQANAVGPTSIESSFSSYHLICNNCWLMIRCVLSDGLVLTSALTSLAQRITNELNIMQNKVTLLSLSINHILIRPTIVPLFSILHCQIDKLHFNPVFEISPASCNAFSERNVVHHIPHHADTTLHFYHATLC